MSYGPPIHPRGTRVELRYSDCPRRLPGYVYVRRVRPTPADVAFLFPFAGQTGVVAQPPWGPGKRNEVVLLDACRRTVNVPAGNLRAPVAARGGVGHVEQT